MKIGTIRKKEKKERKKKERNKLSGIKSETIRLERKEERIYQV